MSAAVRRALGGAAALVVVALALLAWRQGPAGGGGAAPAQAAAAGGLAAAPAAAALLQAPAASVSVRAPQGQGAEASAPARVAGPAASAPRSALAPRTAWDLCGIGVLPVAPGTAEPEELPAHLGRDAFDAARQRLLQRLAQGSDRERAAAIVWESRHSIGLLSPAVLAAHGGHAFGPAAERLAALAARTADPQVLSWALLACQHTGKPCPELDAGRLLQLDGDNALAWLLWWSGRTQPSDAELAAGLAAAHRYRSGDGAMVAVVDAAMPADLLPYVSQQLLVDVMLAESFALSGATEVPLRLCSAAMVRGSPRAAACGQLLQLMARTADQLGQRSVALSVGARRLGWPAEPLARQRKRDDELLRLMIEPEPGQVEQPHSCKSVEAQRALLRERARLGTVAALEARLPKR